MRCLKNLQWRSPFFLMFAVIFLLSLNFTMLRSVRNTLAVVDLGSGSHTIPFFELCGALPASILMTWIIIKLMRSFSLKKVFLITLGGFLAFFMLFSCVCYPMFITWQKTVLTNGIYTVVFVQHLSTAFSMLFYITAELWKPTLINILFWGLINQNIAVMDAKTLYAPLFLGSSLGALCAGPILKICNSQASWQWLQLSSQQWTHALMLITCVLVVVGALTGVLYHLLCCNFSHHLSKQSTTSKSLSLMESLQLCITSKPLLLLASIVLADYIAYSLGEVIFLDVLKQKFPNPCEYCSYLGTLASWGSALTIIMALFVAPVILRKYRWVVAALVLPLCLLLIEGMFFIFLRCRVVSFGLFGWTHLQWVAAVVWLGSVQFSVCRALKYTLFDASKELAFVFLPNDQKIQGKLIIDGICARLGRGGSSAISLFLISLCGGVLASSLMTGIIALASAYGWIWATQKLGHCIDKKAKEIARI